MKRPLTAPEKRPKKAGTKCWAHISPGLSKTWQKLNRQSNEPPDAGDLRDMAWIGQASLFRACAIEVRASGLGVGNANHLSVRGEVLEKLPVL